MIIKCVFLRYPKTRRPSNSTTPWQRYQNPASSSSQRPETRRTGDAEDKLEALPKT